MTGGPKAGDVHEIDPRDLSAEALRGIVEEFVSRESTEYGAVARSFESKCAELRAQLETGAARIFFDPATESVHLVPADAAP